VTQDRATTLSGREGKRRKRRGRDEEEMKRR